MPKNSCAFTGHHPHKFPWRYNEADEMYRIENSTDRPDHYFGRGWVTDFFSNGVDGVVILWQR